MVYLLHAPKEGFTSNICNSNSAKCLEIIIMAQKISFLPSYKNNYPTALKGCRGIVFTHGVRMGGRPGGRREKVCLGCISETVRCRKLILGRDIG